MVVQVVDLSTRDPSLPHGSSQPALPTPARGTTLSVDIVAERLAMQNKALAIRNHIHRTATEQ